MSQVRVEYIGAEERYNEFAITGVPQVWFRGQQGFVPTAQAAAFLATGLFKLDGLEPAFVQETAGGGKQLVDKGGQVVGGGAGGAGAIAQRAIVLGDSTGAFSFASFTTANVADAVTVVNGVATMKLAQAFNGGPGELIQVLLPNAIATASQTNWNYNTTVTELVDSTTIRFVTQGLADGVYAGLISAVAWQINLVGSFRDTEWITGVEMFSPAPCVFVASYAVGGSRSENILLPLPRIFAEGARDFDVAYVSTGYNNISNAGGASAAAYATNAFAASEQVARDLDTLCTEMKLRGKQVRAGIPPGASTANTSLTYRQEAQQAFVYLRKLMYNLQRKHQGTLYLIDVLANAAASSGADAGYMNSLYDVGDGVHHSNAMRMHNGRIGAAQLRAQGAFSALPWSPVSFLDDAVTYANARSMGLANAVQNGLMTGSVSLTGTNIAAGSTAPTNWGVAGSVANGTLTTTADQAIVKAPGEISNRESQGRGWQIQFSSTGAGRFILASSAAPAAALRPGRYYRFEATMYVNADCNDYWSHAVTIVVPGLSNRTPLRQFSNNVDRVILKAGDVIKITGGLFYVPDPLPWTSVQVYLDFSVHNGGVLNVQLSQARLEPVEI